MMTREAAFLGFSLFDILIDRTGVSAMHICPISQRTFDWLIFFSLKKILQVSNDFFQSAHWADSI